MFLTPNKRKDKSKGIKEERQKNKIKWRNSHAGLNTFNLYDDYGWFLT